LCKLVLYIKRFPRLFQVKLLLRDRFTRGLVLKLFVGHRKILARPQFQDLRRYGYNPFRARNNRARALGDGCLLLVPPYLVGDGQAHFRHTFNGGRHQVYLTRFARTEIHFNGLPCPCLVFHGNFDPEGVCQFHLVLFGLQAEGEHVKAELQYLRKPPNTFRAVP
jgi:hypothetical protein